MTDRILWNRRPTGPDDAGDIDEIVIAGCMVHVEQMSNRCWWIGIYKDPDVDGTPYWMGNFTCDKKGRMRFSEQENDGIEWDEIASHDDPRPDGFDRGSTCGITTPHYGHEGGDGDPWCDGVAPAEAQP